MARLRDENIPSQRDIEGVLEDLDPIYRGLDDCEDSETLESYASTLDGVITRLRYLASDWHRYAAQAERDEEDEEADEDDFVCGADCICSTGEGYCPRHGY